MPANVFLLLFACLVPANAPVPQEADSAYLPPKIYLVRAVTLDVAKDEKAQCLRGRLRITDVVAGPRDWQNRAFEAVTGRYPYVGNHFGLKEHPDKWIEHLAKDAEGIWWVYEDPKSKALLPVLDGDLVYDLGIWNFPYQKMESERLNLTDFDVACQKCDLDYKDLWKEGEEFAEFMSELYRMKTATAKRKLLELRASEQTSPMAVLAMGLLARGPKDAAVPSLRALVRPPEKKASDELYDRHCRASAQVRLDEFLCRVDTSWPSSGDRMHFLCRWLDTAGDYYLFMKGCSRLVEAMPNHMSLHLFAELTKPLIAKLDKLDSCQRIDLLDLIRRARFDAKEKKAANEYLQEILQRAKQDDFTEAVNRALWKINMR